MNPRRLPPLLLTRVLLVLLTVNFAGGIAFGADIDTAKHKVILQATTADAATHDLVLTIAGGLQKHYGMDNVDIEVVAYGAGVQMLEAANPLSPRVQSLVAQNIRFSACNNTLKFLEKQTGKKPLLTAGVQVVDDGVVRLVELQEQGFSYVYPR